ncbi:response regulator transcription factor [Paraburkholderia kururiensis]|uniref:Response regulator transcription factor n=1 Tax=Paraburkholderia kururiensis TaxID=984307 RepID=A0ABZ0WLB4_9BURK|nr:response regulator transcription factor [Paraburkholderia kururiensis]WQD78148.1 response regulator transcription factor [Paraburkholderia kururiensis]
MRILLLEDDGPQAELIQATLEHAGHTVIKTGEGAEAIRIVEQSSVDLLILDWMVPGISGMDVLGWVRERVGRALPVLFLSARVREEEMVAALQAGADDYIVKPIRRRELVARVEALWRRAYPEDGRGVTRVVVGRYVVDLRQRMVTFGGREVELTPKEFDIASVLFRNVGRIMSRELLFRLIWGRGIDGVSRSLDTHIYRLRNKLKLSEVTGVRLRSVYTHGYRLEAIDEHPEDTDF